MTFAQWLFHYTEIIKSEKEERDRFEILLSYMELVGSMANPEAGKRLQEIKEQQKFKQEIKAETFADDFEKLKQFIPQKIDIKIEGADNKYILPTFDINAQANNDSAENTDNTNQKKARRLGINKGGEK